MTDLLDRAAVGRLKDDDAALVLEAYISTGPNMIFNHTPNAVQAAAPKPKDAVPDNNS